MRVGIVDDRPDELLVLGGELEEAGHLVLAREVPLTGLVDLISWLDNQDVEALVCDQKLSAGAYAPFAGAEAVAEVIGELRLPALLVSSYIDTTEIISIRRWRAQVPVLISKAALTPESINRGFDMCMAELEGNTPAERIPRRTAVHVESLFQQAGETMVEVLVPGWDPHKAVTFPLDIIEDETLRQAVGDRSIEWLVAKVNVDADRAEDLFFKDFEPAPDPALLADRAQTDGT